MGATMTALDNELEKYKKKGFKVSQRRTLKHGKRIYLEKKRGWLGGFDAVYIYYVGGDSNTQNIREFLKDYSKFYDKNNFEESDKGFFMCSGTIDKGLFRDLKKALIDDEDTLHTIKTKALPRVTVTMKRRTVEEEQIKERVTERKITRRKITEEQITLNSVLGEIRSFKRRSTKISGKRKEKLYTTALTGYLSHAFPSIEMEQSLGKGARVDAKVGNIGIEAKYRPDQNEINRLYGQIDTYLQFLDSVIVVFFDTSSGIVNDFEKKLKRGGYAKQVEVVNI